MDELDQKFFQYFYDQNKDTYIPGPKPSAETLAKYRDKLPEPLIRVWETLGFGVFEKGVIQLVNPDDWDFVYKYSTCEYNLAHIIGITALGNLIAYQGYGRCWKEEKQDYEPMVSVDIIYIHEGKLDLKARGNATSMAIWFDDISYHDAHPTKENFDFFVKNYRLSQYYKVKDKLGPLQFGQCYGYMPLPELGGNKRYQNLRIWDAKTYVLQTLEAQGPRWDKDISLAGVF